MDILISCSLFTAGPVEFYIKYHLSVNSDINSLSQLKCKLKTHFKILATFLFQMAKKGIKVKRNDFE